MMIWGRHKKTEELINVLNVERGIKCDCICPSCGATLVAHKANIAHHFKHFRAIECKGASESAMHLKAKEIISKYRIINLPALTAHLEQDGIYKSVRVIPESLLRLDDKILKEERVGKKIPDLIVSYKTRKILIEIAVTHFVDSEKKLYTRNRGISCVEIDLSDLYKRQGSITDNELIDYVIYRTDNKKWIHNTKFSRSKKKAKKLILVQQEFLRKEKIAHEIKEEENFKDKINFMLNSSPCFLINSEGMEYYDYFSNVKDYAVRGKVLFESYSTIFEYDIEFGIQAIEGESVIGINYISIDNRFTSDQRVISFIKEQIEGYSCSQGLHSWLESNAVRLNRS